MGWALARSDALAGELLRACYDEAVELGELTAILLQQSETGTGRTDIEVQTDRLRLVVEAKRGWALPSTSQLQQYADRLSGKDERAGRIVVVSECAQDYPPVAALPQELNGVSISHLSWSRVAGLVASTAAVVRRQEERRLLLELGRYLKGLMTMQNETSNLVYVAALNDRALDWADITFKDFVVELGRYFHPVGRGYPKTPPNYIGFRYWGQLRRVHHIESYEVITTPHDYIPEIHEDVVWDEHFLYQLGPLIEPAREVRTGNIFRAKPVWCALDLLLTSDTIAEARDRTRARHEKAGIPYP